MDGPEVFEPLRVSSKFALCGLPLTVDSYRSCSFGCRYCFANYRKIMGQTGDFKVADTQWLRRKLAKVYDEKSVSRESFLEMLLAERITWHWGGLSDPFQPIEKELAITQKMVKITNQYGVSVLFSTKADDVYHWESFDPSLHAFQLSVTNVSDRTDLEPNVPPIEHRKAFFRRLKDNHFKVGIRIQPFIPKVSGRDIVDTFRDADYFSIEGLKLVPQDKEQRGFLLNLVGLQPSDFIQMGLMNMKPHIRLRLYREVISALEEYGLPYSIADNDLHHITKSKCCCGEPLIKKSTDFNNTALFHSKGDYSFEDVESALGSFGGCVANQLFASNRQNDGITVHDLMKNRGQRDTSPFSKKFLYGFREQVFNDKERKQMVSKAVKEIQDALRVREVVIWTRDGDLASALYTIGRRASTLYCDIRYVPTSEFLKKEKEGLLD